MDVIGLLFERPHLIKGRTSTCQVLLNLLETADLGLKLVKLTFSFHFKVRSQGETSFFST